MERSKRFAMGVLRHTGFQVEEIPEADAKRADLRVTDDNSTYLVEVKHKLDDPELVRDDAERMARGELVTRTTPIGRNNCIDGVIKVGRKQLDATPDEADAFRVIWLHLNGLDPDLQWKQALITFYGGAWLSRRSPPSKYYRVPLLSL